MGLLDDRVAIITGAARGQGAAAARRFVEEGARVVIADVADDTGEILAKELGEAARYRRLDVSSEDDWAAVVQETVADFGRLDVLVNNAGVLHFAAIEDTTVADFERVVRINQFGCFLGMRAVVGPMAASGGGSIVNVSSVEGLAGMPFVIAYSGTKFAIRGMTKVAALEFGPRKIRVNSVHPGMIDTKMISDAIGGARSTCHRRPASWPWAGWGSRRRSPNSCCSSPATAAPTAPAPSSSPTAARPRRTR